MTVSTLRPSSTTTATGISVVGAVSAAAALSDDSDASYVTSIGASDIVVLALGDLTLPAGALINRWACRLRTFRTSAGSSSLRVALTAADDDALIAKLTGIAWTTPTTVTIQSGTQTTGDADTPPHYLTDTYADALQLQLTGNGATSPDVVRIYEAYVDITYVVVPTTNATAPTGTLTDTNLPTFAWTNTLDADGGAQTHYEIAVVADGDDPDVDPIIAGTGAVASASTSAQITEPLPDATYDGYVRVAQTVNGELHWSDWDKVDFVIDVNLPGVPTINATADSDDGRILVELDNTAGAATTDAYELQRSDDGGTTWTNVRTPEDNGFLTADAGDDTAIHDYEAPNGVQVTYRARALHNYSGLYAASDWATDAATWSSTAQWLKHPTDPALNTIVHVHAYGDEKQAARSGHFQPLGRATTIVVTDTRSAKSGTVVFRCDDDIDRAALEELLFSRSVLLFQVGQDDQRPDRWVTFGELDRTYPADKAFLTTTLDALGWTEVGRPDGPLDYWPNPGS